MFYSQLLLSKTGALGIVWMAAHCHKRLKKHQIQQTNISSSVDKILDDEVRVVTHRILAFLLLGIVRIYSKKVEYLFNDCHEILNRLCSFTAGKSKQTVVGVSQTHYHSISLPKRFELDTFDLGLLEDQDVAGGNVRVREEDLLADGRKKYGSTSGLPHKVSLRPVRKNIPISEAQLKAYTPPRDVFGLQHMDQNLFEGASSKMQISRSGMDVLRGTRFSLEGHLDSILFNEAEEEQMSRRLSDEGSGTNFQELTNDRDSDSDGNPSDKKSHLLPSLEILPGTVFSLEDRLEPMVLDEAEQEQLNGGGPSNQNISLNLWGPVQDAGFDFVTSRSPIGTDCVTSFGVLNENDITVQLPDLKMLNEAEKERGHDKPLEKKDIISVEHVEHPSTQLDQTMVLDEAEQEELNGGGPCNQNISSNLWGPVQDVGFDFVTSRSPKGSDRVASVGVLNESGVSTVLFSDLKMSNEAEQEQGHDKPLDKDKMLDQEHVEHPSTQLDLQEGENHDFAAPVDKAKPVDVGIKVVEVITPESGKCQRPEEFRVSIMTSDSKFPAAGGGTPEVATVQTPGRKECAKILKKRKTMLDSTTLVPNKAFKNWLDDPTDLKRKRRKVPCTLLDAWRAYKHVHIPQSFFEPLISGISEDLSYLECKRSCAQAIKAMELSNGQDDVKSPVAHGAPEQIPAIRSPVREHSPGQTLDVQSPVIEMSPGHTPIAPGTPVARPHEAVAVADSDIIEPATSYDSIVKGRSSSDPSVFDVLFQEETSPFEGDGLESDSYSARTRRAGSYLHRKFLDRKIREEEEVLNLSHLVAGKTKKESARLFYEILVLKTRECIDVQQETAYHDILLRETPKLSQAL